MDRNESNPGMIERQLDESPMEGRSSSDTELDRDHLQRGRSTEREGMQGEGLERDSMRGDGMERESIQGDGTEREGGYGAGSCHAHAGTRNVIVDHESLHSAHAAGPARMRCDARMESRPQARVETALSVVPFLATNS